MNPIIEYCLNQHEKFLSGASSIEREQKTSDLNHLLRSLRCFRALFNLPGSWIIRTLPDFQKKDAMLKLLDQARYVNDMHLQQRVIRENENLLGMDLSYMIQYASDIASKEEESLRRMLKEFDKMFPRRYVEEVDKRMQKKGEGPMYKELLDSTHRQLKKIFKTIKQLDESPKKIHRIRNQLIEVIYCLELLNHTSRAEEVREQGLFLDIWHDRMIALDLISRYKTDHPEGAGDNAGSLEILEDYINQKVLIL